MGTKSKEAVFAPKILSCLKGYNKGTLTADVLAGIVVGIVAIPLAIAFGIDSGVGPAEGLITAIIAGFFIAVLGGSKVQIGGPTGAFIVIIAGIIKTYGLPGLMVATIIAGVILVVLGLFKLGSIIKFVPYPVIIGFTGGIAVTIFSTQMNNFFGLGINSEDLPSNFIDKWIFYFENFKNIDITATTIAVVSLLIIIFTPKISKKIPGSLVAIIVATIAVVLLKNKGMCGNIQTIGDLYEIPDSIPAPRLPSIVLAENQTFMDYLANIFPAAFTIAMLGAIESLLSAMVADGVIGDKHNSNTELIGQGVANIVVPFFGGIPATGAIARTMTNINNGGKTPIAGVIHCIVLLGVLLFLGQYIALIPMPCLAAVLVMVSYNMSGWRAFVSLSKSPKSDFSVLITTFIITVIFNLTVAIEIGLLLALILFIRRTNEASVIRVFGKELDPNDNSEFQLHEEKLTVPEGVGVYEIDGPYFFGVANKFEDVMSSVAETPKVRIIRMRKVPFIDSTGMHNLQELCTQSNKAGIKVILSGVNKHVRETLYRAGMHKVVGEEFICSNINEALEKANNLIKE